MAATPQKSTGEHFSLRLKAFYAALFLTLGVQLPFLPVWLTAKGLDASAVGIVLAVPAVIRIIAIPLATRMADRRDALRAVIILAAAGATAGFCVLAFAQGVVAITLVFALASAAYAPAMMLVDTYALRGLAQRGRAYGPVRLWGSAAFIAASFGAGALLDWIAPGDLIWLMVAAMAIATAAAFALAPLDAEAASGAPSRPSAARLLRDPAFLAAIAAASLIQASHALYYGFSTIAWQAEGFDGSVIGALWALGVIAEIALFALSARLPGAITPMALLLLGAAGAVVRWTAMAAGPPAVALPVLQCLHAFSFGATHLGALAFVARMAPAGAGATAQGYFAVVLGITMAIAMALAGVLYGRFGSAAYGAMAAIACAGGSLALAARRWAN
jgi:PPP family 3-phenylpropionic acid transporter